MEQRNIVLQNRQLNVTTIRNAHIKINNDRGSITVRVANIDHIGSVDKVMEAERIKIGELIGEVLKTSIWLGSVNPEIPVGDDKTSLTTAINSYGRANIWVKYSFIFYGEKFT